VGDLCWRTCRRVYEEEFKPIGAIHNESCFCGSGWDEDSSTRLAPVSTTRVPMTTSRDAVLMSGAYSLNDCYSSIICGGS